MCGTSFQTPPSDDDAAYVSIHMKNLHRLVLYAAKHKMGMISFLF